MAITPFSTTRLRRLAAAIVAIGFAAVAVAQQTQVQRGEYLARAGDCISCHTAKGGTPYAGGLRLDTPFGYLLAPKTSRPIRTPASAAGPPTTSGAQCTTA